MKRAKYLFGKRLFILYKSRRATLRTPFLIREGDRMVLGRLLVLSAFKSQMVYLLIEKVFYCGLKIFEIFMQYDGANLVQKSSVQFFLKCLPEHSR
jgi:hypothetical protein